MILPEHTPNPECVKLVVGDLGIPAPADFDDAETAAVGSPLAARLFALGGIARVLLAEDFVAVTKTRDVSWEALGDRVMEALRGFLAEGLPILAPGHAPAAPAATCGEAERVRRLVETEIQPLVAQHGGAVVFLGFSGGVVELELRGACAGCPSAKQTLREAIEARLRQAVPDLIDVVARP